MSDEHYVGFGGWVRLVDLSLASIPNSGELRAVYAIRVDDLDEIHYIGKTSKLRRRIFGEYFGGTGGSVTKRVNYHLFVEGFIERTSLAWAAAADEDGEEYRRMRAFEHIYGRRPRWVLRG